MARGPGADWDRLEGPTPVQPGSLTALALLQLPGAHRTGKPLWFESFDEGSAAIESSTFDNGGTGSENRRIDQSIGIEMWRGDGAWQLKASTAVGATAEISKNLQFPDGFNKCGIGWMCYPFTWASQKQEFEFDMWSRSPNSYRYRLRITFDGITKRATIEYLDSGSVYQQWPGLVDIPFYTADGWGYSLLKLVLDHENGKYEKIIVGPEIVSGDFDAPVLSTGPEGGWLFAEWRVETTALNENADMLLDDLVITTDEP